MTSWEDLVVTGRAVIEAICRDFEEAPQCGELIPDSNWEHHK